MTDSEECMTRIVMKTADAQRTAAWAYYNLPRWRFIARRRAFAVVAAVTGVYLEAVRESMAYWNNKAARP